MTDDVEDKAQRGRKLLIEPPFDPARGVALTREAAEKGHAEATHLLGLLTASGTGVKQDLQAALGQLRRAAELGHPRARAELDMLGDDIPAWLAFPQPRMLCDGPHIAMVERFLSPAICDWLIELGRPGLERATTYDPQSGKLRHQAGRSNDAAVVGLGRMDMVLAFVRAKISALSGLPVQGFEETQILHYTVGETFGAHVDYLDTSQPGYAAEVARRGQRVLTVLVYLNDGYEGGETTFLSLGRGFKGGKGGALVFSNVTPEGALDKRTTHVGSPPTRGEKWLLSQWIRFRGG
ncbi:MAG: 2OG-Fe(II) oxygenase [Betaproteobacteria bacterium]